MTSPVRLYFSLSVVETYRQRFKIKYTYAYKKTTYRAILG